MANTAEEDKAIAQIASQHGFKRIILVTSSFHMSRAVTLFNKEGIGVFPYPVDFSPSLQGLNIFAFIPSASAFTRTSFAIRELIARAYYWWLI